MAFNAADYTDPQGKAIPWYSQTANAALPDAAKARTVAGVTSATPIKSQTEVAAAKAAGTTAATTTAAAPVTVDGGINPVAVAAKPLTFGEKQAAKQAATNQLTVAQNDVAGTTGPTKNMANTPATIEKMYKNVLGRASDTEGANYWTKKFGADISPAEVSEFINAARPEQEAKVATTTTDGGGGTTTDGGGGFIDNGGGTSWTDSSEYRSMQSQLAKLQAAYDKLLAGQGGGGDSGIVTTGGLIDTDGGGTSGVVYGPDGTMYSSAAAAISAGVTNYTTTKPSIPGAGTATAGDTQGFVIPSGQTGNTNPGGFISGARQQMFTMPTTAQLPGGIANPFEIG
jgi:hypothetical protein